MNTGPPLGVVRSLMVPVRAVAGRTPNLPALVSGGFVAARLSLDGGRGAVPLLAGATMLVATMLFGCTGVHGQPVVDPAWLLAIAAAVTVGSPV